MWLALGMYSYLAAVVMMPIYLLMTLAVAAADDALAQRRPGGAVFVVCLLPMALWYAHASGAQRPDRQRVSARDAAGSGAAAGLALYWRFFDPSYLFVSGDPSMVNSTRGSGLFPMAFAALLPIGLVAIGRGAGRP